MSSCRLFVFTLCAIIAVFSILPHPAKAAETTIRFLATGDPQYENNPDASTKRTDKRVKVDATMAKLNSLLDKDGVYKGVVIAGDLTQNSRLDEFEAYQAAISGYSTRYFDGLGNHDVIDGNCCIGLGHSGYCVCPLDIAEDVATRSRTTDANYTSSGSTYAWDWGDVRFYQAGLYGSSDASFDFIKADLETYRGEKSGNIGKPVVIVQHYCVTPRVDLCQSSRWWSRGSKEKLFKALLPYNVVAMITGHYHNPTKARWGHDWAARDKELDLVLDRERRIPTFIVGATLDGRYAEFQIDYDAETRNGAMRVRYHFGDGTTDCKFVVIEALTPQYPTRTHETLACPDPV